MSGLKRGSREWVTALSAYSDDPDVKYICELYLAVCSELAELRQKTVYEAEEGAPGYD